MSASGTIDLAALEAKLNALSPEQLREQVLKTVVRQRTQQKKYHNSDKAKEYRQKRYQEQKQMIAMAKKLGIYDQIKAEAEEIVDEQLAEEGAVNDLAAEGE